MRTLAVTLLLCSTLWPAVLAQESQVIESYRDSKVESIRTLVLQLLEGW
ncbi:MAG: hypothetical protein AB1758_16065 [Candidatus Eremiobacterota bacterium]